MRDFDNLVKCFLRGNTAISRDITGRKDIELFVERFYDRLMTDPFIGFLFTDSVDIDLREHLPIISDFWETILFQKPAYKRGPQVMNVHLALNEKVKLKHFHFRRWLHLFNKTVDEMFDGPVAERAKERSASIAEVMKQRVGVMIEC